MYLGHFNYDLPKKYIAQKPMNPRDHSRLLILDKKTGLIEHEHFYDIGEFLSEDDVMVMNNSKVIPARLWGNKETGGKMEVFLLNKITNYEWEVLVGGKGQKKDLVIGEVYSNGQTEMMWDGEKFLPLM